MTKDSVALSEVKFDVSIIPKPENQRAVVGFKLLFCLSRLFQIPEYDHVYVESVKVLCVFKCRVIIRSTVTFYLIEEKRKYKEMYTNALEHLSWVFINVLSLSCIHAVLCRMQNAQC